MGSAIIAKAKAMYGNSLKESDYEDLLRKRSVAEVAAFLKHQPSYEEILKDIQENSIHRGQLEELIKKNNFLQSLKLIKFSSNKDFSFFNLNIIQREIDLILATVRSIISENYDEAIAEVPVYLKNHASFDIHELTKSRNLIELHQALKSTDYYDTLEPFIVSDNRNIDYPAIEHALNYYQLAFKRIEKLYSGRVRKNLTNIFKTRIELSNIIKIYRLKKFYNADPDFIRENLIKEYSRISREKMEEIIQLKDPDAVLKYLQISDFATYADENDYVYVEYFAERIKYNLARRYMYFSTEDPEVYTAFVILNQIEEENLTNIIEGIRYNLNESEIRRMLIY